MKYYSRKTSEIDIKPKSATNVTEDAKPKQESAKGSELLKDKLKIITPVLQITS